MVQSLIKIPDQLQTHQSYKGNDSQILKWIRLMQVYAPFKIWMINIYKVSYI